GNNATRVFKVNGGAAAVLQGLTIANGLDHEAGNIGGGGVLNLGNLQVTNCVLVNNLAREIFYYDNPIEEQLGFPPRKSGGFGGGIFNDGTLTITNSQLTANTARRETGGGVDGKGGHGGGIWNDGTLTVSSTTLSGNQATINGGGIHNSGTLAVTSSAFSGN